MKSLQNAGTSGLSFLNFTGDAARFKGFGVNNELHGVPTKFLGFSTIFSSLTLFETI